MLRVIGAAYVSNGNKFVIGIAFFGALIAIAVPLLSGQSALRCPACRKRVKMGATACHHCGRAVARQ